MTNNHLITKQIRSALFANQDIWADRTFIDFDYPHTNLTEEDIILAINNRNNIFWLEIGSMLGGSAILVANTTQKHNVSIDIVCIDPFTGDTNMWDWESNLHQKNEWKFLNLHNGAPSIRQRFLANICHKQLNHMITPIPATSTVGMKLILRLFNQQKISSLPDIIYLDSAHEEIETFLELTTAWNILKDGGILFGDDINWSAVKNDLDKFTKAVNRQINIGKNNHWILYK